MTNLIPLIILGVVFYLMFPRRGGMGMGCCGGHGGHDSGPHKDMHQEDKSSSQQRGDVIDLRESEYTVLSPTEEKGAPH
jgi:hypothetical protein